MMTMLVVLAVVLAPVIVAVTHGPATEVTSAEIADHGHSHGDDHDVFPGHDASDHEHQQSAIIPPATPERNVCYRQLVEVESDRPESAATACLKRPPRA